MKRMRRCSHMELLDPTPVAEVRYGYRISDIRIFDLMFLIIVNVALFGEAIQRVTGFSYCDEIATIYLVVCAVFTNGGRRAHLEHISTVSKCSLLLLFFVCLIGVFGNLFGGVNVAMPAILTDLFTCCKFPVALIASIYACPSSRVLSSAFEFEARLLILIMAFLGLANLFFDFGMGSEPRFGLRASFVFVFDHPTYLVFCVAGLVAYLMKSMEDNLPYIAAGLFVACLSLRSKAFAFAGICLFLLITFGKRGRLSFWHFLFGFMVVLFIGYDQFVNYYQSAGAARAELARQSVAVAGDFFPLGSGFATYGSAVTAQLCYYSPLYFSYGLSSVWGLAPGASSFLSDTFWPTVMAQFGYFGFIVFAVLLIALFAMCYLAEKGSRLAVVCAFAYLLISSTSESAFFNPSAVYIAMCMGLAISSERAIRS